MQHANLLATHAIDINIWLIIKTNCIMRLYCIMITQNLDTDTVYQLYRTSLKIYSLCFLAFLRFPAYYAHFYAF